MRLKRIFSLLVAVLLLTPMTAYGISAVTEKPTPYITIDDRSVADTGYFGDGSDGALYIKQGETVTLPVPVPHQSIVERNYTSVYIEAGGTLTCAAPNAGLVLRVQGDCTINGLIDQKAKAPKINPNNNFPYPVELQCGAGGRGGEVKYMGSGSNPGVAVGGKGMNARPYGGGYSGGGGGGLGSREKAIQAGGNGGDADLITTLVPNIFIGGASNSANGLYGGGGAGSRGDYSGGVGGGSSPGSDGTDNLRSESYPGGAGGGAGNIGGGVLIMYVRENFTLLGKIDCSGGDGGNGGRTIKASGGGGGGGGAGGGSIYITHCGSANILGSYNVGGGSGGTGYGHGAAAGNSGLEGKVFVTKAPDTNPPVISSVTVSTAWALTNSATIIAADDMSGIASYAVTNSAAAPTSGWQTGSSFTMSANGTYYAWCKDKVGNVSDSFSFEVNRVDTEAPVITDVVVTPAGWTANGVKTITVTATDGQSGISGYGITTTTAAPMSWQSSNIFNKPAGTYYLWCKDNVGRVSGYKQAVVDNIDTDKPIISGVTIPQEWGKTSTITIAAIDGESGLKEYAISGSNTTAPTAGWQSSASFTLDKNGTYYAWAWDTAGNVSLPIEFVVNKVDDIAPVISGVTVPQEWSKTSTIAIAATDTESGIKEYAISGSNTTAPTVGRQSSAEFSLSTNGKYYAWAWDTAGNVSLPIEFVVTKVDTISPVISDITMQQEWGKTSTIAIAAADIESGIKEYAISDNNITAPTVGWQSSAEFSLSTNGTYYAWARDTSENISAPFSFVVDKIDKLQPVIESIILKEKRLLQQGGRINTYAPGISIDEEVPDKWVKAVEIIIKAKDSSATSDDGCSGVADYAITASENTPITLWQVLNSFTLTENGIIFLWVRDVAGNISQVQSYNLNKIDDVPPIFGDGGGDGTSGNNSVTLPSTWGTAADVTIKGGDNTGVQDFAVTATTEMPVTWQDTPTFNIDANGIYFAWMKDRSNNIIGPDRFEVDTVDKLPPLVNSVSVENGTVIFDAADAPKDDHNGCSGISGYSVTKSGTLPTPIFHRDRYGSEMKLDYDWLPLESIKISESGAYEARTIDFAGNVSLPLSFDYTLPPITQGDDTDKPNEDNIWENIGNDILTDNSQAEDKVYSITMDGGVRIPTSLLRRLRGKDVILRIEQGERYVWALDCRTIGDIPMWQIYYNLTISENEKGNRYFYQLPYFTPQTVYFDVTQKDKSNFPFLAELSVRIHYSFGDKYIYYRLKDGELIGGELPMEKLPQYLRKKIE